MRLIGYCKSRGASYTRVFTPTTHTPGASYRIGANSGCVLYARCVLYAGIYGSFNLVMSQAMEYGYTVQWGAWNTAFLVLP